MVDIWIMVKNNVRAGDAWFFDMVYGLIAWAPVLVYWLLIINGKIELVIWDSIIILYTGVYAALILYGLSIACRFLYTEGTDMMQVLEEKSS